MLIVKVERPVPGIWRWMARRFPQGLTARELHKRAKHLFPKCGDARREMEEMANANPPWVRREEVRTAVSGQIITVRYVPMPDPYEAIEKELERLAAESAKCPQN